MLDPYWTSRSAVSTVSETVDPTDSLEEYVKYIKPYHTKIYEVMMSYSYDDEFWVRFVEKLELEISITGGDGEDPKEPVFICGPGWDSGYNFGYGVIWGGGWGTDYLNQHGQPLQNINLKIEQAIASDDFESDWPVGTFVVNTTSGDEYEAMVIDKQAGKLAMVNTHIVEGVNHPNRTWTIRGNILADVQQGTTMYIPATGTDNITFTVVAATSNGIVTVVEVRESIPLSATATGLAGIPIEPHLLPWWPGSLRVDIVAEGTPPSPIRPTSTYYFLPQEEYGIFGIAHVPYPTRPSDFVRFSDFGDGKIWVRLHDVFYPGAQIIVTGSQWAGNDGKYVVAKTATEGQYTRIWPMEPVRITTQPTDRGGWISYNFDDGPISEAFCRLLDGGELTIQTYFGETLEIKLELHPSEYLDVIVDDDPDPETVGWGQMPYGSSWDGVDASNPISDDHIILVMTDESVNVIEDGFGDRAFGVTPFDAIRPATT